MATRPDPQGVPESKSSKQGYRYVLLSLHIPALALGVGQGITTPVLPGFAEGFGVPVGLAAMVFTVQLAGGLVAAVPVGYASDRIGRRWFLLAGPLITAVSLFLTAFATGDSFTVLLVYRFLGGVGQQMWMVSRIAVIADSGGGSRGRQITSMFGLQRVGNLAGPVIGGFAATWWGAATAFVLHGAVSLIAAVSIFAVMRETAPANVVKAGGGSPARAPFVWSTLLERPLPTLFTLQYLAMITRGGGIGGGTVFLFAEYAYDPSAATLGVLSSVAALLGLPLIPAAGHIMDRYGRKVSIVPGLLVFSLSMGFLALVAAFDWSFTAFVVGFMWMQIVGASLSGSMQTLGSDLAPAHARGTFFGVGTMVQQAGFTSNPLSFSILTAVSGFTAAFAFLLGTGIAAASVLGFMIKETLQKPDGGDDS